MKFLRSLSKAERAHEGDPVLSVTKKGSHLHDDIHGILVFLLGFPKGPHVEGAEPQGQGTADGEEEKQREGGQPGHPGGAPDSARGPWWLACKGSGPPPWAQLTYKACR